MLQNNKYPDAHTHRDLKERLYYEIISYFEKGKVSVYLCMVSYVTYTSVNVSYNLFSLLLKHQTETVNDTNIS